MSTVKLTGPLRPPGLPVMELGSVACAVYCPSFSADVAAARYLREQVLAAPVLFTKEIAVRGRGEPKVSCAKEARHQPRQSRTAAVEVRAATVRLRRWPPAGRRRW